jgi:5'-3' exonuclease, N-terminal resolvase-like domain/T4 RNase H, C terminal
VIIVDLNQTMISNFMAQIGNHTNIKIEEDLLRHMILNSIRSYNAKFKAEYGEMVIACDDRRSWRRGLFPYYKANRKKAREKSEIDWNSVFEVLEKVRNELRDYFPYRVIQVDTAEADDVIGTLCHEFGNTMEKILIISGDKDFKQLQTYMNVRQYDPVRKRWLDENNPDKFLKEHIMKGDTGDGIPNFLSRDDTFVVAGRQKPLRSAKLDAWTDMDPENFCDDTMLRNYKRNQQLIDLSCIPDSVKQQVMETYKAEEGKGRDKLFNYFIQFKLKNLLTDISQF